MFVHLVTCFLSLHLSFCLFFCLSLCFSFLFVLLFLFLPMSLPVFLSIYFSVCHYVSLSISLSFCPGDVRLAENVSAKKNAESFNLSTTICWLTICQKRLFSTFLYYQQLNYDLPKCCFHNVQWQTVLK